jgi:hypothetical protein
VKSKPSISRWYVLWLCILGAFALGGCTGGGSTRLTTADMQSMAREVSAKLTASDFMRGRDASSERMQIALTRPENLTDDVMPHRELWFLMAMVRADADLIELGRQKNFIVIIPADSLADMRESTSPTTPLREGSAFFLRDASHTMHATLRNATRTSTEVASRAADFARSDVYLIDFRLQAVATGELLWTDSVELKRQALGRSFD